MFDYESAPESIIKNRNLQYNFYFFIIFKEMEFIPSLICFKLFFYMCYNLFLTLAQDYFHLGQF